MSEPKEKYFIIDFSESEIFERNTLPEILSLLNTWIENDEEIEEQLDTGAVVVIKGKKVSLEVKTIKKVLQK